tara:strand:+ start:191 stop:1219 length:1029 start_codon:yes stop_codon:yes gene_type:complete
MLGYLSVNGSLIFKKSYTDSDYYDYNYFLNKHPKIKGYNKLKCKKGKGSRLYTMNKRARKKIENATLLLRHYQNRKTHSIKFLTLTFAQKHKKPNQAVSRFFNRLMKEQIITNYWWVKEYHAKLYEQYKELREHYHCLVCVKRYTKKIQILELWQLQAGINTIIIEFANIYIRNKYNSFLYQIVCYVAKYSSKGIDKFNDRVYSMSEQLSKQANIPIIYAKTIKNLLQSISKNANNTEDKNIYYRTYWNQAFVKKDIVKTYFKTKKEMESDKFYQFLYPNDFEKCIIRLRSKILDDYKVFKTLCIIYYISLNAKSVICKNTQEEKNALGLEIDFKNFNLKPV